MFHLLRIFRNDRHLNRFAFFVASVFALISLGSCSHFGFHKGCTKKDGDGKCSMSANGSGECSGHGHGKKDCKKCSDPQKCEEHRGKMGMGPGMGPSIITQAKSLLSPTKGNRASGDLILVPADGGIRVSGKIKGLPKNKSFGFHIHEFGDCSSGDGKSAGGHLNPFGKNHGALGGDDSHLGDLGNISSDKTGTAQVDITLPGASFFGPRSILGRGFIVHADPDDLKTQPTGNAGARIACGSINASAAPPAPASAPPASVPEK